MILAVLVVGLAVQLVVHRRRVSLSFMQGPEFGEPLPDVWISSIDGARQDGALGGILSSLGGCSLVVILSPSCPVCEQMRDRWRIRFETWRDSVDVPVVPVWVVLDDRTGANRFVQGRDLGETLLYHAPGRQYDVERSLGVVGTPTSYLAGRRGEKVLGLLGAHFPPVEMARDGCS